MFWSKYVLQRIQSSAAHRCFTRRTGGKKTTALKKNRISNFGLSVTLLYLYFEMERVALLLVPAGGADLSGCSEVATVRGGRQGDGRLKRNSR